MSDAAVRGPAALYCDKGAAIAPVQQGAPGSVTEKEPEEPETPARRLRPREETNAEAARCEVADSNLLRAEAALRAARLPLPAPPGAAPPTKPWDRKTPPLYSDRVGRRLGLNAEEQALLTRNGFVVLERTPFERAGSFARLFHELYQAELPLYVSVDSVLNAVYASNDALIADVEKELLRPLLGRALHAMHCALPRAAAEYPPEVARDLDLYLSVALSLLGEGVVPGHFGTEEDKKRLLAQIGAAGDASAMTEVALFGRSRIVDFSQFLPRGHYTPRPDEGEGNPGRLLAPYFRAAMWLSRIELNVVSRSCRSSHPGLQPDPSETPREAADALALADLAERSGALSDLLQIDRAWRAFAGPREDLSVEQLLELRRAAGITGITLASAEALRNKIGDRFRRTARLHYMPPGSNELPVIATLLGPAVVADAAATRPLVHSVIPDRHKLGGGDIGFMLGHDHAGKYLAADLKQYPTLPAQLRLARGVIDGAVAKKAPDLYSAWLGSLRAIASPPAGTVPSFMQSEAFADLRLNSAIAGFGQLRHNYVLLAAQSYSEGGCAIPDGYVDPAVGVYEGVAAYAQRGAEAMRAIDPGDRLKAQAYFKRLGEVMEVLRTLSLHELQNQPLPAGGREFLSMVAEMTPETTGSAPTYTGWYFDLFRRRQEEALVNADLIADFFTAGDGTGVSYVGASWPAIGVFVVDTGGVPRLAVGPVARAYEAHGPLDKRLTDETAHTAKQEQPWATSYVAPAPLAPELALSGHVCEPGEDDPDAAPRGVFTVRAKRSLGPVRVELLDHHYAALASLTRPVGAGSTRFVLRPRGGDFSKVQGVALHAGSFSWRWQRRAMDCSAYLDFLSPPAKE